MNTTMQALCRAAAAMGLALAGLLAAPLAQAGTGTPHPISRTEGAGRVMAMEAGGHHSCALKPDGSVACWGRNDSGQAPPSVAGPFLAVSSGGSHTCGLKPDGSVACWGLNGSGQAPPSVAGPFLAVSAGASHTCGLKPDGSVACWGSNISGQLGDDLDLDGGNYG